MRAQPVSASPTRRVACPLAMAATLCLSLVPAAVRADVVLDWNKTAVDVAIQAGQNPFAQARYAAIVQVAVFTAVNAVTGEYEPYINTVTAAPVHRQTPPPPPPLTGCSARTSARMS